MPPEAPDAGRDDLLAERTVELEQAARRLDLDRP